MTRPAEPTPCPGCGDLALRAGPLLLRPTAHRLGLYDPTSGAVLSTTQVRERLAATGLAGHAQHRCPTGQALLFGAEQ